MKHPFKQYIFQEHISLLLGSPFKIEYIWANYNDLSRRLVTLNGGLVREFLPNDRNIQV